MLPRSSSAVFVFLTLLTGWDAFAHRPYDRPVGAFKRADGTEVSIVRHYVDGIFFADPVSVQFRMPNGTNVAQTAYNSDAVVRPIRSGVEVYQFPSTWVPVAGRVHRFDGYELKDITPEKRSISPLIHLAGHWIAYCVVLCVIAVFAGFFLALRAVPNRGWRIPLRWIAFGLFSFAALFCAYDILVFEPVSPLVLAFIGLAIVAPFIVIRRNRHATVG